MTELTPAIQEALVCLRCYHAEAAAVVRSMVDPKAHDPFYREIAEAADRYFKQFKRVPGEHTLDIIDTLKHKFPEKKSVYAEIFHSMEQTKDGVNHHYVLSRAAEFAREQSIKTAIQQAVDLMQSGNDGYLDKAESLLLGLNKKRSAQFDPGMLFNDSSKSLSFLDRMDDEEFFPTGIEHLDRANLGPARKTMHLLMAASNRGKSWWLVNLGRHAMLNRKRVLHVTCEMSDEKVAMRYVQALFSVRKRDDVVKRMRIRMDKLGKFTGFEEHEMKKRPHLSDPKIRKFLAGKMAHLKNRPPLIIKKFPSGSLTVDALRAYLDGLETVVKFIPDLLIIDYPDIMKQDPKNLRQSIGQTYVEIRGIADERNLAVAAVTQGNRASFDAALVKEKHTGEDISKIQTADTVLSFNQTDEELRMGVARLFTVKARDEAKHQQLLISQAYGVGQFALQALDMGDRSDSYWKAVNSALGVGDDDEEEYE